MARLHSELDVRVYAINNSELFDCFDCFGCVSWIIHKDAKYRRLSVRMKSKLTNL